jgi:hypothetical protein
MYNDSYGMCEVHNNQFQTPKKYIFHKNPSPQYASGKGQSKNVLKSV